jgi:phosphatidylglycerophosphatase A
MWSFALLAAALFCPAVWAAGLAERITGRRDPGWVVIDEVLGLWLTLPAVRAERPLDWVLAVALFRIFDIAKPWPLRRLEKLPGGLGVVADDVGAGLCAMMSLGLIRWLEIGY